MGMFDDIRCKYPLPVAGANALDYQTKDTPAQFCDQYEIREDGTLWHQAYDIEDHSDPKAKGLMRLAGMMTAVNQRWEQVPDFTGEICFYTTLTDKWPYGGWIEWSAYFEGGKVARMNLIRDEPLTPRSPPDRATDPPAS